MKTKRIISSVLAALMLATTVPQTAFVSRCATVYAEENGITKTNGGNKVASSLTATYTIADAETYKYQWVTRSTADGAYCEYPLETSNVYVITPRDKNMYLNCYVTGFNSEGKQVGEKVLASQTDYQVQNLDRNNRTEDNYTAFTNKTTPATYKFRTRNFEREYILLDESYVGDNDSAFYVMTEFKGKQMPFDELEKNDGAFNTESTTYNGYYFNPQKSTNIGYKLNNNDWLDNNWTFDTDVANYVNTNHCWWTEAGLNGQVSNDYSFTAGFSLISLSEAVKYREKIGYNLNNNYTWWWTRSQRNASDQTFNILACKGGAEIWNIPSYSDGTLSGIGLPAARPTFYLKGDFFKNVRLRVFENDDTNGTKVVGDEVCKMLVRRYTRDEMAAVGYTDDELAAIGYEAPKVATVTLAKGTNDRGATEITATIEGDESGATEYKYQWLISSDNATWVELPTETTSTYMISSKDMQQYLNCRVTPVADGAETVTSKSGLQITALGKQNRLSNDMQPKFPKNTPSQYKFSVGGKEYILLDRFNDEKSAYFVMTEDCVGDKEIPFDTDATKTKFAVDSNSTNNIGYKLNSGLSENKINNEVIDERVISHINKEQIWWTEQGNDGNITADYDVKAGVSLISMTELLKYFGKFGSALNGVNYSWWTRTQRDLSDNAKVNVMIVRLSGIASSPDYGFVDAGTPITMTTYDGRKCVARPVFYLNSNFFKDVKVDVIDSEGNYVLGDDTREEIKRVNTDSELQALGYTSQEISYIKNGIVANVTLEFADSAGVQTITATVSDNKTGVEDYSYQWLTSSDNSNWIELPTETSNVYRVSSRDKNQYITCRVTINADEAIDVQASSSKQITDLNKQNRLSDNNQKIFANTTPSKYKFTVGDREYILLDRFNDENSAYYIMSEGYFGKIKDDDGNRTGTPFDTDVTKVKLDTSSSTNIAYKLNNELSQNKINGDVIDSQIVEHINKNYVWWTERGNSTDITSDYQTTMAIGLLSMSEANKYIEKFGVMPAGQNVFWWIRTQRGQNVNTNNIMVGKPGSTNSIDSIEMKEGLESEVGYGPASYVSDNRSLVARPTFYLDSDFFKEVKVTVFDAEKNNVLGDDVRKEILRVNPTVESLENVGYESNEISAIMYPELVDAFSIADSELKLYNRSDLKFTLNYAGTEGTNAKITYTTGNNTYTAYEGALSGCNNTYEMDKLPNGTNNVEIRLFVDDALKSIHYKTMYVLPDVSADYTGQRAGVNLHIGDLQNKWADMDILGAVHKVGFNDVRLGWTWSRAEKEAGKYDFSGFKKYADRAKELNITVTSGLLYNNTLYSGSTSEKNAIDTDEERNAFVNFAKEYVKFAKDYPNMNTFEIWNEPNSIGFWDNGQTATEDNKNPITAADAQNYSKLVKATYEGVKSVDPKVSVLAGSIDISKNPIDYIGWMFDNNAYQSMDALSYHPYNHGDYNSDNFVNNNINEYKDLIVAQGGYKQLVPTEFGISAMYSSDAKQGKELPKAMILMKANGIDNGEIFNFIDTSEQFGLFDKDLKAKDALYTVAQVNSMLDGAVHILTNGAGYSKSFLFIKDGQLIMPMWAYSNTSERVSVSDGMKLYDSMGNEITPSQNSDTDKYVLVEEDMGVVYVVYPKADTDTILGNLIANSSDMDWYPSITGRINDNYGEKLGNEIMNELKNYSNKNKDTKVKIMDLASLTDKEKSAVLSLVDEIEVMKGNMSAAITSERPTATTSSIISRYNTLLAVANTENNVYAKSILKFVENRMRENELLNGTNNTKILANNNAMEAYLYSATLILSPVEITNKNDNGKIDVSDGKINLTISNGKNVDIDIFVAQYGADDTLSSVQVFDKDDDLTSIEVGAGATGKIYVWTQGTMTPLDSAEF